MRVTRDSGLVRLRWCACPKCCALRVCEESIASQRIARRQCNPSEHPSGLNLMKLKQMVVVSLPAVIADQRDDGVVLVAQRLELPDHLAREIIDPGHLRFDSIRNDL